MRKYTAEVIATGGPQGTVKSQNGNLNLNVLEDRSNDSEGTNPEQLFAAAYGSGFLQTLNKVAWEEKVELKEPKVIVKVSLDDDETKGYSLSAAVNVVESSLEEEVLVDLVRKTYYTCPYSKAVAPNVEMIFTANKIDVEV